jgi:NADPH:quinone reductase-like Zn-dependent oxidoreductase
LHAEVENSIATRQNQIPVIIHASVGDEVMAMADLNKDGGWATGGIGGYAVARDYLTVKKSSSLSFDEAAVLPICFLSAYIGIYPYLNPGDTIYIPGGAGGVGHLAIQMAAHALGASRVISSGSKPDTIALAKKFGASHVFNYRTDVTFAKVKEFTNGNGVDLRCAWSNDLRIWFHPAASSLSCRQNSAALRTTTAEVGKFIEPAKPRSIL